MLLEIEKLAPTWTPVEYRGDLEDPDLSDQIRLTGPVELNAEIRRRDDQVEIRGTISGAGTVECSRCLEPVLITVSTAYDVVFARETDDPDHETEVSGENLGVAELTGITLDLKDFAREQLLLDLPARVLCREDCLGFCQTCGANKNLQPCGCESEAIDPRWQALRGMLDGKS
jgi:uncharacterized protein